MGVKRGLVGQGNENGQDSPGYQNNQQRVKLTKGLFYIDEQWLQDHPALVEAELRKMVRPMVEQAVDRHHQQLISRSSTSPADSSEQRKFKLQFDCKLPNVMYTGNKVTAEGGSPIRVELVDTLSGCRVTNGPLASGRVEIVVVHGHFKVEQLDDWTMTEFTENIVPNREDRGPLLVGTRIITLNQGIGFIDKVQFRDNSSRTRSKMFRLGMKMPIDDQVREAVSTAFRVKDQRGATDQKHNTLALKDEVWRVPGIAKDGKYCQRLAKHKIHKVKDFVRQYNTDKSFLRQILGAPQRKFDTITQWADTFYPCGVDTTPDILPPAYSTEHFNPTTLPRVHPEYSCDFAANQDQPGIQMPFTGGFHDHFQPIAPNFESVVGPPIHGNIPSTAGSLGESFDEGQNLVYDSMAPTFPTGSFYGQGNLFDISSSSWMPMAQSIAQNVFNVSSSSYSNMNIFSSTPKVSEESSLGSAKPKAAGWSKIRAWWRILVKLNDDALKTGKFQCFDN